MGRAWAIIGAVVGVVGAVTGVISVWPILTANASGVDDLRISAMPYPESATEWALPADTDLSTYPAGTSEACGPQQREWLQQSATQIHRTLLLDLRNVADSGPMLSISDVRIEGERATNRAPAVLVVCDTSAAPPRPLEAAMLDASSARSVAVFSAEAYGIQQEGLPDLPVTWNLAPGETGLIVLRIGASVAYDGTLTAGVVDKGTKSDIEIAVDGVESLSAPPLVALGEVHLRAGSALTCVDESDAATVCDVDALMGSSSPDD